MRIGIDPGHGGKDPGAIGPGRLYEKDVALGVSLELSNALKSVGFDTCMTRSDDRAVELSTRSKLLNSERCDLAVSVHCNAAANPKANYISTFIQGRGGQAETLAIFVQRHLVQATGWPDGGVRVKNLHMTRETRMPAILVELGFISNPDQEKWLRVPENQKKLARAICKGICDFAGKPYKEVSDTSWVGKKIETDAIVEFEGKAVPAGIITINGQGKIVVELATIAELLNLKKDFNNSTKKATLARR